MKINVPPDLEELINKRLSSGAYSNVEDVLRRALHVQDAQECWTDEERRVFAAQIESGYQQALRGELRDGEQVRHELQARKANWLREHPPAK